MSNSWIEELGDEALDFISKVSPALIDLTKQSKKPIDIGWIVLHALVLFFGGKCSSIFELGEIILKDENAKDKLKSIEEGFCDLLRRINEKTNNGGENNKS